MKKQLLGLLLLVSSFAMGQAYQQNGTFGIQFKRLAADSGLTVPKGDTSNYNSLTRGGNIVYKSSDKKMYYFNETKWLELVNNASAINFSNTDLTFNAERIHTINGFDLTVQNSLSAKGGYFKLFSGGAGIFGAKNSSNLFTGLQANATQSLALMTNDNDRLVIASNGRIKFNNYNLGDSVLTSDGSGNLVGVLKQNKISTDSFRIILTDSSSNVVGRDVLQLRTGVDSINFSPLSPAYYQRLYFGRPNHSILKDLQSGFQIFGTNGILPSVYNTGISSQNPRFVFAKIGGNDWNNPLALGRDTSLGELAWRGYDGSVGFRLQASIKGYTARTVTPTASAGYVTISTTDTFSTTPSEVIRFDEYQRAVVKNKLLIGNIPNAAPFYSYSGASFITQDESNGITPQMWVSGLGGTPRYIMGKYNGTLNSPTPVTSGQILGEILFNGQIDNTGQRQGASIISIAAQDFTTTSSPSNLYLSTTPTGSTTPVAGVIIDSAQRVLIANITSGSLLFSGAGGVISQDNSNLFWDNNNKRLGIKTSSPSSPLDVHGSGRFFGDGSHTYLTLASGDLSRESKMLFGNSGERFQFGLNANSSDFSIASSNGGTPTSLSINYITGSVGVKNTSPTAHLHLGAGTTTSAPFKITNGDALTTPQTGTIEFANNEFSMTHLSKRFKIAGAADKLISDVVVANTSTETTIYTSTINANEFVTNDVYSVRLNGIYSQASGSGDNFTMRVKIGGTTVATVTSSNGNVTNTPFDAEFVGTVRSTGVSGTIQTYFKGEFDNINKSSANTAATTINTTTSNDITVTIQWSAAKTGNTITIQQGFLRHL